MDHTAVDLDFYLEENTWRGKYTHVAVEQSVLGREGPYEKITFGSMQEAKITSEPLMETPNLNGKWLHISTGILHHFTVLFNLSEPDGST